MSLSNLEIGELAVADRFPRMGWLPERGAFRLRAPGARFCELVLRDHPDGEHQVVLPMEPDTVFRLGADGSPEPVSIWTARTVPPLPYYRYRVHLERRTLDIADPWSRAVVRRELPGHPAWSVALLAEPFDWGDADGVSLPIGDAIICEAHVADLTADPDSGARLRGTFDGLVETHPATIGGLTHVLRMGLNALELLPLASWPVRETERKLNHWGYMPSFPMAVTDRFSRARAVAEPGDWVGIDRHGCFHDPALELKRAVRSLHEKGVAVIVDVVLNHVSMHDDNPLLRLDPGTWFRRGPDGRRRSDSGCGNDLASEDPDMRGLLVHTIRHWFEELRIDGIRLDLAELIDDGTLLAMGEAALDVREDALLIAEPWSLRGHRGRDLAEQGWTVWNDRFRDTVRGCAPDSPGFVFGALPAQAVRACLAGSGDADGGHLPEPDLSLNYLESHDDHTLGDFVRLALGEVEPASVVSKRRIRTVRGRALRVGKLAAATLLASRGPVMLAQGQSFARAKVTGGRRGRLSANSHDRDDGTNHIDWRDRAANPELVAWYARWIALRRQLLLPAWATGAEPLFITADQDRAIGYHLQGPEDAVTVLLNASPDRPAGFDLPAAPREVWAGHGEVELHGNQHATLAPTAAAMLVGPRLRTSPRPTGS